MEILFSQGEATLGEVAKQMESPPTRPAMRSIVKILENKGHVEQSGKRGREHVFRPRRVVEREGRSAMGKLLATFFGGSMKEGLAAYLSDPKLKLDPEELKTIEAMVREAREKANSKKKGKKS